MDASRARFDPADVRVMEEAADTANLLVLEMAIQALERDAEGDSATVGGASLLNVVERGVDLTAMVARIMSESTAS